MKAGKVRLARAHRRAGAVKAGPSPRIPRSGTYEEAMLNNVIHARDPVKVRAEAAAFVAIMSNFTPALSDMHLRHGIRTGRFLYRLYANSHDMKYRTNPILGLPDFLEKAGYPIERYDHIGSEFRISLRVPRISLGLNAHTFEAGIISGFTGASEGRISVVSERECSMNSGDLCRFESGPARRARQLDIRKALSGLSERLAHDGAEPRKVINRYYCNLMWGTVLHREYERQMMDLAHFCGGAVCANLSKKGLSPEKELKRVMDMLDLGRMTARKARKFSATLAFDPSLASRARMAMSTSFMMGYLDASGMGELEASEEPVKGMRVIRVEGR